MCSVHISCLCLTAIQWWNSIPAADRPADVQRNSIEAAYSIQICEQHNTVAQHYESAYSVQNVCSIVQ